MGREEEEERREREGRYATEVGRKKMIDSCN